MADPQGEYEETIGVDAPAKKVFDFVAEVGNMPKYLPTTKQAASQGKDRVHVEGKAHGHDYKADGFLRADRHRNRLEWGSDEHDYSGWMTVGEDGNRASVTVHISMHKKPGGEHAPSPEEVREGIRKGLESIRNEVEGSGGKQEPRAAG